MTAKQESVSAAGRSEPSERTRSLIEPLVPQILNRAGTRGLVALAVIGAAARGEETWKDGKLVSDLDLVAVVRWPNPLTVRRFLRTGHHFGEGVELGCWPLFSLSRYRTLAFYEAKRTAWVCWGKPDVFELVRLDSMRDIPRWEGIRLLLNRVQDCLKPHLGLMPPWYAAVKAYLALGEAGLVFSGRYEPSYRARWAQLEPEGQVLESRELWERVRWAKELKLGERACPGVIDEREHERWLLEGLRLLLSRYLEQEVTVEAGLHLLAQRNRHLIHRALYIKRHVRHPHRWVEAIGRDPAFAVWTRAIVALESQVLPTERDLRTLLTDLKQTRTPYPE